MRKLTVYHGTNVIFDDIEIRYSQNKRDFGRGFYTTTIEAQAESWARSVRIRRNSSNAYVNVYELTITDDFNIKEFDGLTVEWLDFVKENRIHGGLRHHYDIVIGPVANDNTLVTISRYIEGTYTADEAIRRLKYFKSNNQISFHTEKAIEGLKMVRRYEIGY